jgi:hypothetical protein
MKDEGGRMKDEGGRRRNEESANHAVLEVLTSNL